LRAHDVEIHSQARSRLTSTFHLLDLVIVVVVLDRKQES
jgi:hypothetical protein